MFCRDARQKPSRGNCDGAKTPAIQVEATHASGRNLESLRRQQEGGSSAILKRRPKESTGGDSKARAKAPMALAEALLSSPEKRAFLAPRTKIGGGLPVGLRLRPKKQRRCRGET